MLSARISELIVATQGRPVGRYDTSLGFDRIEIDSRKVRRGDVFWALEGERHDGHHFIPEAQARGAAACVADARKLKGVKLPAVAVDDTRAALGCFAAWHRQRCDALVVAVTGSVGKTTTRNMVHAVLGARFTGVHSPHNYNNDVGVPLSLLAIEPQHEFAVLELAASRVGEIGPRARLVQPEVGLITAIAPAHLAGFESLDNIGWTKGELLETLPPSGFAVLNGDDELVRRQAPRANCPVRFAGERVTNDIVARGIEVDHGSLRFQVDRSKFSVPATGRHFLTAAVMAVAVGREIGMSDEEIAAGLKAFRPAAGRCQVVRIGPWTVIDDTYNASPRSMQAACDLLRDWQGANQRVLVAGDMLELGPQSDQFHAEVGANAARAGVDCLVALGAQAAVIAGTAKHTGMDAGCLGACRDLDTLAVLLDCWLEPGDLVLVKGSRGMRMELVLERLRELAGSRKQEAKLKNVA
jgi:UDP-N-acetylmuramoyl-tripeptide--D-alanyl-D-alanine ligase